MNNKRDDWKQANPRDQLIAVFGALKGHWCNALDGIITPKEFIEKISPQMNQISMLVTMVEDGDWESNRKCIKVSCRETALVRGSFCYGCMVEGHENG